MSNIDGKEAKNMEWMYEGPKSTVNREDYLLGKKIDKNYELFSDVVIKDKAEEQKDELFRKNRAQPTVPTCSREKASKTSALDLTVVRTEDPLVALKMREEQRKREMFENPLLKLKAQRVLKEAYEKQMMNKKEKKQKQEKKNKRAKSRSSSSSSDHARKRKRSSATIDKKRRDSSLRFPSRTGRKDDVVRPKLRSPLDDQRRGTSPDRGYSSSKQHSYPHRHHEEGQKSHREQKASSSHPSKSSRAGELEARRAEMLSNAKWRDEVRNDTIEKAAQKLRKEEEQFDKVNPAFLKPLLGSASSSSASVEKRLHSNKKNLQKSHDYMERSFVSRK